MRGRIHIIDSFSGSISLACLSLPFFDRMKVSLFASPLVFLSSLRCSSLPFSSFPFFLRLLRRECPNEQLKDQTINTTLIHGTGE